MSSSSVEVYQVEVTVNESAAVIPVSNQYDVEVDIASASLVKSTFDAPSIEVLAPGVVVLGERATIGNVQPTDPNITVWYKIP